MYKNKKIGTIGIIITFLVLLLLVVFTNINQTKFSKLQKGLNIIIIPIQNGLTYLKNKISKNDVFFENIDTLKQENTELRTKNKELEQILIKFELLEAENKTLREYSDVLSKYPEYKGIPANIIYKDISNFGDTVVINVGSTSGVKENMAVVASGGLVGRVVFVTDKTAKVQTIIDSSCSVSASISTTKESVMVKGLLDNNNSLELTYLPTEAKINIGEEIETSGVGGIYPKGIKIGKITQIVEAKNIIDRYAIVDVAVDFSKLETVLVIDNL